MWPCSGFALHPSTSSSSSRWSSLGTPWSMASASLSVWEASYWEGVKMNNWLKFITETDFHNEKEMIICRNQCLGYISEIWLGCRKCSSNAGELMYLYFLACDIHISLLYLCLLLTFVVFCCICICCWHLYLPAVFVFAVDICICLLYFYLLLTFVFACFICICPLYLYLPADFCRKYSPRWCSLMAEWPEWLPGVH